MRLIHTADWHLGRLFHGVHLTEDQAYVLDQFVDLVKDQRPDAILIAGDVYDRAVPPPEAVRLLNDTLSQIVIGLGVRVILIAGNHDSPERLDFGARLMEERGLHIAGVLGPNSTAVTLEDRHGPVKLYALPYAEPAIVRHRIENPAIVTHNEAMTALTQRVRAAHSQGLRSIIMAHAFVMGGEESESERPLSVGGTGAVDVACFDGFDYVALGHLHRPQRAGSNRVRYSGSLLKYSFSEANHAKSVQVVEMDESGTCRAESIGLTPRRDIRRIEGLLSDLLEGPGPGESHEDYVMVTLLDEGAILDPMGKIREVYPNALHIERAFLASAETAPGQRVDHKRMSEADLFAQFFEQVEEQPITEAQAAEFASVVDAMRQAEREAAP